MRRRALAAAIAAASVLSPCVASGQRNTPGALFGLRFGGAQHQSAYLDLLLLRKDTNQEWEGYTFEIEGGRSGGQLGLGMASSGQITPVYHAQAVVMRTWKRATDIAPAQTFVGVEVQIAALLGVSYGRYWRISGTAPGDAHYHAPRCVIGI